MEFPPRSVLVFPGSALTLEFVVHERSGFGGRLVVAYRCYLSSQGNVYRAWSSGDALGGRPWGGLRSPAGAVWLAELEQVIWFPLGGFWIRVHCALAAAGAIGSFWRSQNHHDLQPGGNVCCRREFALINGAGAPVRMSQTRAPLASGCFRPVDRARVQYEHAHAPEPRYPPSH